MKTVFKKSTAKWGCYAATRKQDQFIKVEDFTIADFLETEIVLKDKAWFIRNNCELTLEEKRLFAIGCALCVLPIYEAKYPDNKAPREAIEAAQAYLAGTIDATELALKRKNAYAAAVAADDASYAAAARINGNVSYKELLFQFFKNFFTPVVISELVENNAAVDAVDNMMNDAESNVE